MTLQRIHEVMHPDEWTCDVPGCNEIMLANTEEWSVKFCPDHWEAMGSPEMEPADLGPTLAVFARRLASAS